MPPQSNAWTGEASFGGRCLHTVDAARLNPYEETLAALCSTLEAFDDDNLYPCYGFGDGAWTTQLLLPGCSLFAVSLLSVVANYVLWWSWCCSTMNNHDDASPQPPPRTSVCFPFGAATSPARACRACYPDIASSRHTCDSPDPQALRQQFVRCVHAPATSRTPPLHAALVTQAMRMVVESGAQYHILLLIADGQITCGAEIGSAQPTPQEVATAQALADASTLPLSVVVMGVGDGPWCAVIGWPCRCTTSCHTSCHLRAQAPPHAVRPARTAQGTSI